MRCHASRALQACTRAARWSAQPGVGPPPLLTNLACILPPPLLLLLLAAACLQVMAEIALLSELQHTPHVLPLWLALDDGVQLHVVTPFCAGGDLRQALRSARSGPLPEAAVRDAVVAPLLAALAQLHARGYVHRDVKPENIFITKDGSALLGDFGMAVRLDQQQQQQHQGRRAPFSSSSGSLASCATDLPSDAGGSSSSPPCSPPARRSSSASGGLDGSGDSGSRFSSPSSPKAPLVAGGTPAYSAPEVVAAAFDSVPVAEAVVPQVRVAWLASSSVHCNCRCIARLLLGLQVNACSKCLSTAASLLPSASRAERCVVAGRRRMGVPGGTPSIQ